MAEYSKGHIGRYTGNHPHNAKYDHAHTHVTDHNLKAAERDDAAHMDYLKRDVLYDAHHGYNKEHMTADEKHISKLAGDLKYDKEQHCLAKRRRKNAMASASHIEAMAQGPR